MPMYEFTEPGGVPGGACYFGGSVFTVKLSREDLIKINAELGEHLSS